MQKFIQLIIILLFIFTLVGCGYKNSDIDSSFPNELNIGKPDASLDTDKQKGKENEDEGKSHQPLPGQLTASVLFDHSYYNYWNSLFQNPDDIFYNVHSKGYFNPTNRITINIPNVYNAKVELINENHNKKIGYTNNQGICYLFLDDDEIDENNEYQIKVTYKTNNSFKTFDNTIQLLDNTATLSLDKSENENHIQVMFIIDTTSSMIDELSYLQSEISDVISKIKSNINESYFEVALLFYRDINDEYLTKYFDFTTDLIEVQKNLNNQQAQGGGDYPEAVEIAFSEALTNNWCNDAKTKIVVHVADAPAHNANLLQWSKCVTQMKEKNIHIITIASSDIDKNAEYYFRCQSLITDGAYIYLTDDSGIGNPHLPPTIQESLEVEHLNSALIRVISGMHLGYYTDPINFKNET